MSWLPTLHTHFSVSPTNQTMKDPSKSLPKINSRKLSNIGRNVVTGRNVSEIIPSHTGSLVPRPFTLNGMFRQSNGNKETHSKLRGANGTNNRNNSTLNHSTVEKKSTKSRNRSSISMRTPINVSVQENKTSNTRNRLPSISTPKRANAVVEGNNSTTEKKSNSANSHKTSNTRNRLPSVSTPNRGNRHSSVQESKISYQSLANRARQFLERAGK